jgi:alkylhydroperoxidase family enzyme
VSEGQVPDGAWEHASGEFSPVELAALLFAIVAINGYNRLAIATRMEVGGYRPAPVSG